MFLFGLKAREDFAFINDFAFFFRVLALAPLNMLKIEEAAFDYKLLAPYALVESRSVELKDVFFEKDVFRRVIVVELHVSK